MPLVDREVAHRVVPRGNLVLRILKGARRRRSAGILAVDVPPGPGGSVAAADIDQLRPAVLPLKGQPGVLPLRNVGVLDDGEIVSPPFDG